MLRTSPPLIGALGVPKTTMEITRKRVIQFMVVAGLFQAATYLAKSKDEAVPGLKTYVADNPAIVARTGSSPTIVVGKATYLQGNPKNTKEPRERRYQTTATGAKGSIVADIIATQESNSKDWKYSLDSVQ